MRSKEIFRRSWCRLFHRKHIKRTPPMYALATGITGYCSKCYDFVYVDELGQTKPGSKAKANP